MKAIHSIALFVLVVFVFSNCEKDHPEVLPGERYPEFVGQWKNDTTVTTGPVIFAGNLEFDFHEQGVFVTANNVPDLYYEYAKWEYDGDSLKLSDFKTPVNKAVYPFKVLEFPSNDTLIIRYSDPWDATFTYHLSRNQLGE